jgi:hypothetical protein
MSEHDDANATDQTAGDAESRPQDPRVELLRPDPSQPATQVRTLRGLWGNSDRPGYKRLYLSSSLESYAEFRVEDVLDVADIAPQRAPFVGEQATRVTLRRDAHVDITHSRRAGAADPFDLDIRFGRRIISAELPMEDSVQEPCSVVLDCLLGATPGDVLCEDSRTCGTCHGQNTCHGMGTCVDFTCDESCGCPPERVR